MSWYPIETAPKDGTDILGYNQAYVTQFTNGNFYARNAEWCVVHWDNDRDTWVESTGEEYQSYDPVMWQPLTTPEEYQLHAN